MEPNFRPSGADITKFMKERVRKTTERLEADFSKNATKVHRFPQCLRGIGGHYIVPSVVALGPYHRSFPHLLEMEDVKYAAAHYLCMESGHSVEDVYGKILSIAGEARGCYDDYVVAFFNDAELADMMFLDGCFLLYYINSNSNIGCALLENRMTLSTEPCMLRDIFLLENQLPWLVLEALMDFVNVDVHKFLVEMASLMDGTIVSEERLSKDELRKYKPPHFLGLLRLYYIGSMPSIDSTSGDQPKRSSVVASSAIELAEMGVKMTTSNMPWFADMTFQKSPLFCELSLTPLFLSDVTACWLVNMAAFEACTSTSLKSDGYTISSYLSLLAMLMDKEEDMHQLRAKHLVRSFFSNQELLHFFKSLARYLKLGRRYQFTLQKIEEYKRERRVRIAVHKFLYNNFKTIATLLSIAAVLVGIFKTLLSLKQH